MDVNQNSSNRWWGELFNEIRPKKYKWKEEIKRETFKEIFAVIFCGILIISGIILDNNDFIRDSLPKEIDGISTAIMQTQASIAMVIFAIIALVTGRTSDSYMGISLVNYYLDIRPRIFKQRRIIFWTLSLTVISVIFRVMNYHLTVISIFIVTIICVQFSMYGILAAFRVKKDEYIEIQYYFDYLIEKSDSPDEIQDLLLNYIEDWRLAIGNQNNTIFAEFMKRYLTILRKLLSFKSNRSIEISQRCTAKLVSNLLTSESENVKARGLILINRYYSVVWERILKYWNTKWDSVAEVSLVYYLEEELYKELGSMPSEQIERGANLGNLYSTSLRINICLEMFADRKMGFIYQDTRVLNELADKSGKYLYENVKKNNTINENFWIQGFGNYIFEGVVTYVDYQVTSSIMSNHMSDFYFYYFTSLLRYGHNKIVKKAIYQNGIKKIDEIKNSLQLKFYLMFHIYAFYLAESEKCIDIERSKSAKLFLDDPEIRSIFQELIGKIIQKPDILSFYIFDEMFATLRKFEIVEPQYVGEKEMIMHDVVTDFWVFLCSFLSFQYNIFNELKIRIDVSVIEKYYQEKDAKEIKTNFRQLYCILIGKKNHKKETDLLIHFMNKKLDMC